MAYLSSEIVVTDEILNPLMHFKSIRVHLTHPCSTARTVFHPNPPVLLQRSAESYSLRVFAGVATFANCFEIIEIMSSTLGDRGNMMHLECRLRYSTFFDIDDCLFEVLAFVGPSNRLGNRQFALLS